MDFFTIFSQIIIEHCHLKFCFGRNVLIYNLVNVKYKQVINSNFFQYHNKVECFKMHKIDEMCDLGAHANLIVPPSWVVKLPPKRVRTFFGLFILLNYFVELLH